MVKFFDFAYHKLRNHMFYNAKLFATRLYFILILSHFKWPKSSFACGTNGQI